MPLIFALLIVATIQVPGETSQLEPIQEPSGKQIAESLGYRTAPPGWQNVDTQDPYIMERLRDQ